MAYWYFGIVRMIVAVSIKCIQANETINFGILYNHTELFINTNTPVFHMEIDQYKNDGSLLIGTKSHLQTVNTEKITDLASLLVTGFAQVNKTHAFIVDNQKHCIKVINRENNQLRDFAGTCGTSGYAEGRVGVSRFHKPWGTIADVLNHDRLLVADKSNHAIRSVNLKTGEVGTVIKSGFSFPKSLQWEGPILMVTNYNFITMVGWWTNGEVTNTLMAGTTKKGDTFGRFDVAQFGTITDVEKVKENQYIVADFENSKLKVLDMINGVVSPVCSNGTTTECSLLDEPISMLNLGNILYVGTQKHIYKLTETPTRKRLVFKAEYTIACYAAIENNAGGKAKLKEIMLDRRTLLQDICAQNCTMSTTLQPSYECADEYLLIQYWSTDTLYPAILQKPPQPLFNELKKRLHNFPLTKALGVYPTLSKPFSI